MSLKLNMGHMGLLKMYKENLDSRYNDDFKF